MLKPDRAGRSPFAAAFVLICSASLVLGLAGPIPAAHAATIAPDTFADDNTTNGNCTLREAIRSANENTAIDACDPGDSGLDTISLSNADVYQLSVVGSDDVAASGDLDITQSVIIQRQSGTDPVIIDGGDLDRVFHVLAGGGPNATFIDVRIQDGNVTGTGGGILFESAGDLALSDTIVTSNESSGNGAGILMSAGTLSMTDSEISENNSTGAGVGGLDYESTELSSIIDSSISGNSAEFVAGIAIGANGSVDMTGTEVSGNTARTGIAGGISIGGNLTLDRSTVADNTALADNAGGLSISTGASVTITNSTLEGNRAVGDGAFAGSAAAISNAGTLVLENSTVSGNIADTHAGGIQQFGAGSSATLNNVTLTLNEADANDANGGSGGGIRAEPGAVITLQNTILADNSAGATGDGPDCGGTISSGGHNLVENEAQCTFNETASDLLGQGPDLVGLTNNGGTTETHMPNESSPAVDAGNPAGPDGTGGSCEPEDQTGLERAQDGDDDSDPRCDIGAVERPGSQLLEVDVSGPGEVTSDVDGLDGDGIECPANCDERYSFETLVTLTAATTAGNTFEGWGGACTSQGATPTCEVTMDQAQSVTATFSGRTLAVSKPGSGSGTVTSIPPGIECGSDCIEEYSHGTIVSLNAAADADSLFAGWSGGGCTGTGGCQVTMDATKNVTATFDPRPEAKRVTLDASKKKVPVGKKVVLTAGILPCAGHQGDSVSFLRGSKVIASVATSQGCVASTRVRMRRKAKFTAVAPPVGDDDMTATSPPVTVKVKQP